MKRKMVIKKSRVLALVLAGCMLTGCSSAVSEEENLILIEKEEEELAYEMAATSVSDVKKTGKTSCTYQQVNDQSLSFSVSGKRVSKVYVEEGDTPEILQRRVMEQAEWQILPQAINMIANA